MPSIDVADEAFIVAAPSDVASRLADPRLWRRWWPSLGLTVFMDRGIKGTRWSVTGELQGSMEVWLEPWHDGVIVHWYLRAEPIGTPENSQQVRTRFVLAHKGQVNELKDELERGRAVGTAREG